MRLTQSSQTSPAGVLGRQEPRVSLIPDGVALVAPAAITLAARAGLRLDPWQAYVIENSLRERPDGKHSAFEVGLVVPRQQGKGSVLEARELIGLFALPHEKLIIHSAHLFKTAQEAFRRILFLIENTPQLNSRVARVSTAHGSEGIELRDGSRILFMARSAGSARGFSADLIILDEAYNLSQSAMAAMLPTMAAKSLDGNPQIWYTSSAGMPESEVLASVRERAIEGSSDRLAYFEWSAPDDADPTDVQAIAMANPGLGRRMSLEHVESEREAMGDEEFKRERLGIWAKLGGESVIDPKCWADGLDESVPDLSAVAFAVDVPPSREKADIVMVGFRADGEPFAELIERRLGTSWVPLRLAELALEHSPVAIVVDAASSAGALLPDIKRAHVRTLQVSPRDYFQACGQVFDLIAQRKLHHSGQEELLEAVDAAQQKVLGGGLWKWTRGNDVLRDISPLVGITLAWYGLSKRGRVDRTKRRAVVL